MRFIDYICMRINSGAPRARFPIWLSKFWMRDKGFLRSTHFDCLIFIAAVRLIVNIVI